MDNCSPTQDEEERAEAFALISEVAPTYGDSFIGACLAACGLDSQRTTDSMTLLQPEGSFPSSWPWWTARVAGAGRCPYDPLNKAAFFNVIMVRCAFGPEEACVSQQLSVAVLLMAH